MARSEHPLKHAREVAPRAIDGNESTRELLGTAFPAFVGRQVRRAYELMDRSAREQAITFATLSGAMTPAGLHQSCVVPLIERGLVDVLTTTGANLYHDAHRVIGHRVREISPTGDDRALREAGIIRIYDLGFSEETLLDTDRLFATLLMQPALQRRMTTWELHHELGRELHRIEQALDIEAPCLLSACYQRGLPVFCGAPQDGSIFLNVVKLRALLGDEFRFELDVAQDVFDMAAVQHHAHARGSTAIWILGGGVPKNYTLQGEPTLSQIFGIDAEGFDIDVQFCVDTVDNGALSSCPAGEGHTWGKVTEDFEESSVYVRADVTAVVPWLVHALLGAHPARPPRRLCDEMIAARAALQAEITARREIELAELADVPSIWRPS